MQPRWSLWLLAIVPLLPSAAGAQPVTRQLAEAGVWSVVEQQAAPGFPAGCMIVAPAAAVAIRSDGGGDAIMIANAHWDLPKGLHAVLHAALGPHITAFAATSASANTALAPIAAAALPSLLNTMAQWPSMTVTLFPGMPVHVRLTGFTTVLPAFRRCAGLG